MSTDTTDVRASSLAASSGGVAGDASDLLLNLQQNGISPEVRRRLVIEVQVLPVPDGQRHELAECLRVFIDEQRDSNDADDLVAVGSAIRKLIVILPPDELPSVAGLLEAGHRAPVALEIELEITKSVVRRLSSRTMQVNEDWRPLADRMAEIATTYLNDRLLPRENYAATALNAVLALALMQSGHVPVVRERIQRLRLGWFRRVARPIGRLAQRQDDSHSGCERCGRANTECQSSCASGTQPCRLGHPWM